MSTTDEQAAPAARRKAVPIALLVLAAVLVAAGALLIANPRAKAGPSNEVLVEGAATSQVISQVSTALNQVLSYDYKNPDTTTAAAKKWLAGDAVGQYNLLFKQLNERAPGQDLSFVAKVVTAGVVTLDGNSAQLLVFLDQKSTRASDAKSSVAAAQVQIAATLTSGTWQITNLQPL